MPWRKSAISIATQFLDKVVRLAKASDATGLYVSATPSGSAIGFYRHHGFELVDRPHPALYALEPKDIHMVKPL